MSQSLYTAMGGISAAQTELQVVSNNIANMNTTGFKSSSVNFSDVFSTTRSYGSVATSDTGGTNPIQVGVGTKVSSISKDFTAGSWISTGSTTDLMIQGNGFFTVQSTSGEIYYTRAGNFSFDSSGNLVTAEGYKVLGTDSILSSTSAKTTVYVPKSIIASVVGSADIATKSVSSLNNLAKNITSGDFKITTTGTDAHTFNITLSSADVTGNVAGLVASIQGQINTQATAAGITSGVTVGCSNGKITVAVNGSNATAATYSTPSTGATNFLTQTELTNSTLVPAVAPATGGTYSSKVLNYSASVSDLTSAAESISLNSYSINNDGSLQATYSNGDTLSVALDSSGNNYKFIYTTAEGVEISGADCAVDPTVAVPGNFVAQLASVTNTDGLVSVGSNMYEKGPNSGQIYYSVGSKLGIGKIQSGGLESSNVDISREFSNMILAQRAVQANSRVFTTTSDIMDTIVQMGR